jgi:hypothetical protein
MGETPSLTTPLLPLCCQGAGTFEEQRPERVPHPECGSRKYWDKYLILVITRVEAGDRGPFRRWRLRWPCWPAVGGQRTIRVDTWTTRRLYTDGGVSPLPLPPLPPVHPHPAGRVRRGLRGIGRPEIVDVAPETRSGAYPRRSAGCGELQRRRVVRRPGRAADGGAVTSCHPVGTRSPQAVHIPGDNFSTCRSRSRSVRRPSPSRTGAGSRQPPDTTCGQSPTEPVTDSPQPAGGRPSRQGPAQRTRGTVIGGGGSPEDDSDHCRARLLILAVSSVTCV